MSEPVYVTGRSYQIDYLCGWRFLLSRRFRDRVRRQWGGSIWMRTACILGGVLGILVTSAVALFFALSCYYLAVG